MRVTDQFEVEPVSHSGSDGLICKISRLSISGMVPISDEDFAEIINFLIKNRTGSPFEHAQMMFRIHAPIFVWREFINHHIGIAYSEESWRDREVEPVLYMPSMSRDIMQVGKPGDQRSYTDMFNALVGSYEVSWKAYKVMLNDNVAKEVAQMCLPMSLYSTAFITMNVRSLMNFLSLNTRNDDTGYAPSSEMKVIVNKIEEQFKKYFPMTQEAFDKHGRIGP